MSASVVDLTDEAVCMSCILPSFVWTTVIPMDFRMATCSSLPGTNCSARNRGGLTTSKQFQKMNAKQYYFNNIKQGLLYWSEMLCVTKVIMFKTFVRKSKHPKMFHPYTNKIQFIEELQLCTRKRQPNKQTQPHRVQHFYNLYSKCYWLGPYPQTQKLETLRTV